MTSWWRHFIKTAWTRPWRHLPPLLILGLRVWIFELADWEWRYSQVGAVFSFYILLTSFKKIWKDAIPFAEWLWLCQKVSCLFIFFNNCTINIKSGIREPLRIKHFAEPKILSSFLCSCLREHVILWDHCSVWKDPIQTWVNGGRGFRTDSYSRAAYKHQSLEGFQLI